VFSDPGTDRHLTCVSCFDALGNPDCQSCCSRDNGDGTQRAECELCAPGLELDAGELTQCVTHDSCTIPAFPIGAGSTGGGCLSGCPALNTNINNYCERCYDVDRIPIGTVDDQCSSCDNQCGEFVCNQCIDATDGSIQYVQIDGSCDVATCDS